MNYWIWGVLITLTLLFIVPFYVFLISRVWTMGKLITQFKFMGGFINGKEKKNQSGE